LQDEDRLIQGPPPYRVHGRGTPQIRVGKDSEATVEVLNQATQACVMAGRHTKQIHKGMTNFAIQANAQMETLEVL
jgi:hypothetical protein